MITWRHNKVLKSHFSDDNKYCLSLRSGDGYYDVYLNLSTDGGAFDHNNATKLNKSRLRLHAAKKAAEDHFALSQPSSFVTQYENGGTFVADEIDAHTASSDETVLDEPAVDNQIDNVNIQLQQEALEATEA